MWDAQEGVLLVPYCRDMDAIGGEGMVVCQRRVLYVEALRHMPYLFRPMM